MPDGQIWICYNPATQQSKSTYYNKNTYINVSETIENDAQWNTSNNQQQKA